MVVINGQSADAAAVLYGAACLGLLGCGLLVLEAYSKITGKFPWLADASLSHDAPVVLVWILLPLLMLGFLILSIVCARLGSRFGKGGPQLVMSQEGLLFSAVPGASTGRSIQWADVDAISEPTEDTCPKRLWGYIKMSSWYYGPLFLRIDLRRPGKVASATSGPFRLGYWLFEQLMLKGGTQHFVIEALYPRDLSHQLAVEAISSLARDPALRERYCRPDATYVVRASAPGVVRFDASSVRS